MPNLRDYHIFISHSWDYSEQYDKIIGFLDSANNFSYSNYSVSTNNPLDFSTNKELRDKIKNRISNSSCVIILAGMYANYSDWINYEIDVAVELGKPIIGVEPWGQQRIPVKIYENADVMVGWNANSIVTAVRDYAL